MNLKMILFLLAQYAPQKMHKKLYSYCPENISLIK